MSWALLLTILSLGPSHPTSVQARGGGLVDPARRVRLPAGVDWRTAQVVAVARGAPDVRAPSWRQARLGAMRAARRNARPQLIDEIRQIPISAGLTLGEAMAQDTQVRQAVEDAVDHAKVVGEEDYSDHGVRLELAVPLEALWDALPAAAGAASGKTTKPTHTGVVVDARGLALVPGLRPGLVARTGKVLYRPPAARREGRMTRYFGDARLAQKSAGNHPLLLRAVAAHGSELVLDETSAAKVAGADHSLIEQGKVAIWMSFDGNARTARSP